MDTRKLSSANQTLDRAELDSHADTCWAGANTTVLEYTGTKVSIQPFTNKYKAIKDILVATVAMVYDCPKTGRTYLLILNEALYIGKKLQYTLLCPNQLRDDGVKVENIPRQFGLSSKHAILVPRDDADTIKLPLKMEGIISYLITRQPTSEEILSCERL
jgi:hypothetical protein